MKDPRWGGPKTSSQGPAQVANPQNCEHVSGGCFQSLSIRVKVAQERNLVQWRGGSDRMGLNWAKEEKIKLLLACHPGSAAHLMNHLHLQKAVPAVTLDRSSIFPRNSQVPT